MGVVVSRWRVACLLVVVAAVTGACTPAPADLQPSRTYEDSQPSSLYEVTSDQLCTQEAAEAIGAKSGLVDVSYSAFGPGKLADFLMIDCSIRGLWADERFHTRPIWGPTSSVQVEVYNDVELAIRYFDIRRDSQQSNVLLRAQQINVPQPLISEIDGWWDEGWRIQWYEGIDLSRAGLNRLDAVRVFVNGGVRHDNLVIFFETNAPVPSVMWDEGYEALSNLGDLLIEEARRHVSRTPRDALDLRLRSPD